MERAELIRLLGGKPAVRPAKLRVVSERDPRRFQEAFAAAAAGAAQVLLADPAWGARERAQRDAVAAAATRTAAGAPERGWLGIATGGTTGALRFARHDQATIAAAGRGFCGHFAVTRVNAVGVLPLHHVSGLMAWLRCALTGGVYRPWDWKELEAGRRPPVPAGDSFLSLVPTQLQRLLGQPAACDWLRRFHAVFLGGGPPWPELLERAAAARLPLSLTYGMTETAAMITALRPAEFLAGARHSGRPLPHARVTVLGETARAPRAAGRAGIIAIRAESLARGYWPDAPIGPVWTPNDLGRIGADGGLRVLGRADDVIITGGKKVHPLAVEAVLRATGAFRDVAVLGLPDGEWGQVVAAFYPAEKTAPDWRAVAAAVRRQLPAYQRPKRWIATPAWPRNAQGKLNKALLRRGAA